MSAIGGFFELEPFGSTPRDLDPEGLCTNTGRNALELILRHSSVRKLHLPYYMCPVLLEPLRRLDIEHSFYFIDRELLPELDPSDLSDNEALLYIDYFGICPENSKAVSEKFPGQVILDLSQAFFEKGASVPRFYSFRKFFGVPDGGMFKDPFQRVCMEDLPEDRSQGRMRHLIGRLEEGPEASFPLFQEHEAAFEDLSPKRVSPLTRTLLQRIDRAGSAEARCKNFRMLHRALMEWNELAPLIDPGRYGGPLVYPLLLERGKEVREYLIEQRVYCPTYWPEIDHFIPEGSGEWERRLQRDLIPLPIDQRYGEAEMGYISELIHSFFR